MTFRDQAAADLSTFLNVDEFGDSLSINGGTAVACVLVNDEERDKFSDDGVTEFDSVLYVRASDIPTLPKVRDRMSVNGRKANAMRVDQQQGMLVIRLTWYQS